MRDAKQAPLLSEAGPDPVPGIEWATERRKLADLRDYPKNPRKHTEKGLADLKAGIASVGYIEPIAVNLDGTIIGGHARRKTLKALGLTEIDVRVPDRMLTEKEVEEAVVRLNRNIAGEFDFDMLAADFGMGELVEWGFTEEELGEIAIIDLPEAPQSVKDNTEEFQAIKDQRKHGNEDVISKTDTERYLVIVFADRAGRENAVKELGLPEDERYVPASAVSLKRRGFVRSISSSDGASVTAAPANKSGATG